MSRWVPGVARLRTSAGVRRRVVTDLLERTIGEAGAELPLQIVTVHLSLHDHD